ncbi:LmbE family N-acetylglucosaminyl deacetylase [Isoptericola jiangsuensis]|uniref:LmbE family N-acetylglucosaminyl deacetylase n=1 Tax=Isoptericola jiangsuensis TaxID=548579 RepID=A0A2A9EVM8_9MICO|nr:response regulator [Isoptericola jiangsuensis]PFG42948.1 LmbE family N-acetylglucosaminyl deacetylase [Isoptericola jiangsuensis]
MPEIPLRVLVVEDDPDTALLVRTILERRGGMDVVVAGDTTAALAALDADPPDLLLTDIELPGGSGLDLAREVRTRGLGLPVIVMTAHASVDYAVGALREDVDEFLVKPVDSATLVDRVRALVADARRRGTPALKVLAVGAHPDDVEIGAGGTLAAHRAAGDLVTVLTLSGGGVGGAADDRRREAQAASDVIGARLVLRDFEDTRMEPLAAVIVAVEEVVKDVRPDVVYTHSANDRHQDHHTVHRAVDVAARGVATVACFQSPSSTIDFRPSRFVPVDDHLGTKLAMLAAFASQAHRGYMDPDDVRATARYWARFGGVSTYAEPFEVVRASTAPVEGARGQVGDGTGGGA